MAASPTGAERDEPHDLRFLLALLAGVGAAFAPPAARPQPAGKPIHIVVTFTPGGAPDILARVIAERLSTDWNQTVVALPEDALQHDGGLRAGPLATKPNLLVVHNDVAARTVSELIVLGKREGKMTFASAGSGTSIHVSGELFKTMTGIDMTHVPDKGRASAIRSHRRPRDDDVRQHAVEPAAPEGGQAARARRHESEAVPSRAGHSDDRRAGPARV